MRIFKIKPLFMCVLFSFVAIPALSEITIESAVRYGNWGFKNSRTETDTDIDKINIEELTLLLTFPFIKGTHLISGYRYSYLWESETFLHLLYSKNNLSIESGFSLGFQNDLPVHFVPGIYGKFDIVLKKHVVLSAYGHTSFFLNPLVSLSSRDYEFDQNLFGLSNSFIIKEAWLTFSYRNENIVINTSPGVLKKNIKKTYEISISTDLKDFWINSRTALGGEIADFETGSTKHRLAGIYIEETVTFTIKRVDFSTGMKATISHTPLKDISSVSPPTTPSFGLYAKIKWKK